MNWSEFSILLHCKLDVLHFWTKFVYMFETEVPDSSFFADFFPFQLCSSTVLSISFMFCITMNPWSIYIFISYVLITARNDNI